MKQRFEDKIRATATSALSEKEIQVLSSRKYNQLFASIVAYIIIAAICILFWNANSESANLDNKSFRINFSKIETETFQQVIPYIGAGIFLATSFFFVKFLRQTIIPLSKDIRNGIKLLIYFTPEESPKKSTVSIIYLSPYKKYSK